MPTPPVTLFDLASQQARWLSVRQSTVAGNIANANTPGYRALEVEPFESVLGGKRVLLASTNSAHLGAGTSHASFGVQEVEKPTTVLPSENTVTLEQEMMKSGEVRRAFELNTAIVKAFHRMLISVSRS
jgi:flagellar basal-body rod protein FlgB